MIHDFRCRIVQIIPCQGLVTGHKYIIISYFSEIFNLLAKTSYFCLAGNFILLMECCTFIAKMWSYNECSSVFFWRPMILLGTVAVPIRGDA